MYFLWPIALSTATVDKGGRVSIDILECRYSLTPDGVKVYFNPHPRISLPTLPPLSAVAELRAIGYRKLGTTFRRFNFRSDSLDDCHYYSTLGVATSACAICICKVYEDLVCSRIARVVKKLIISVTAHFLYK
jgi:hypothetical protein